MNPDSIRNMRAVHDHLERRLLEAPPADSAVADDDHHFLTYIYAQFLKRALDQAEEDPS